MVYQREQETTKRVSTKTIQRFLKKRDVWKRIRPSPDAQKSERRQAMLHQLQPREAAGACELWYCDGAGFGLTPCVPYAWQPRGDPREVPTARHSRRVNV